MKKHMLIAQLLLQYATNYPIMVLLCGISQNKNPNKTSGYGGTTYNQSTVVGNGNIIPQGINNSTLNISMGTNGENFTMDQFGSKSLLQTLLSLDIDEADTLSTLSMKLSIATGVAKLENLFIQLENEVTTYFASTGSNTQFTALNAKLSAFKLLIKHFIIFSETNEWNTESFDFTALVNMQEIEKQVFILQN